jgi:DNA-binding NarL/FixJ family response regulator
MLRQQADKVSSGEEVAKGRRLRILLADDNRELRLQVARALAPEFDVVATVSNGRQLLEEFDRCHPDVVVTDISMPIMDGFEAAAELQHRGHPPVVFFTVHDDEAFFAEAKSVGGLAYILKRSPPSTLAQAIRSAHQRIFFESAGLHG